MVLVDTSVWVRFLANRTPYTPELERLLALDEVAGHEMVYGELLIGDRGGRRKVLAAVRAKPNYSMNSIGNSRNPSPILAEGKA